ncbi:hypothetical protein BRC90_03445 [Halobacteriales archaeon QS_4_69_34]|nr:MAG: hypothetical protein BRC90_03445 [Halobacteriales archaeon QS_4_69_34]
MAENVTLFEVHLHGEGTELSSDVDLDSGLGSLLRERFGSGDSAETEAESEATTAAETDGGDEGAVVDIGGDSSADEESEDENEDSGVVEIDPDEADENGDSGGGFGRKALTLALLVGLALAIRWYLDEDDYEFDDEL